MHPRSQKCIQFAHFEDGCAALLDFKAGNNTRYATHISQCIDDQCIGYLPYTGISNRLHNLSGNPPASTTQRINIEGNGQPTCMLYRLLATETGELPNPNRGVLCVQFMCLSVLRLQITSFIWDIYFFYDGGLAKKSLVEGHWSCLAHAWVHEFPILKIHILYGFIR